MQNTLRKKPTYDELINYLEVKQPTIKYPNRTATLLRNSHYLSQFDNNLFDVEEQQKKKSKAQLRESEIRNVVSQTQTASLLRSEAAQEQNRGTTKEATRSLAKKIVASAVANSVGKITNAKNDAKNIVASAVANSVSKIFDMSADDKADEILEEADAVMELEREKEERKNDKIKQIVSTHLGEEVKDLPYIQQSTASSSSLNPNPVEKPSRSRSPKTKPLHGGFTRQGKALVGGVVEKPTEDKTIVVAKPRSRSRSPPKPVGSGDLGGTTDKKTQKKSKRRHRR
jgi:hypothetical protein